MLNKVTLILSLFSVLLVTELSAQNVYFTGVGRALVTSDNLKDNLVDTTNTHTSSQKGSGGYTLFDLGVNAKATDVLRAGVILRLKNQFGGFFSDGAFFEFRQLQMEGLIAKKVKYEIGDIYLKQTQYTLWNTDPIYNKYEAGIFSTRRDIVNYENFFIGNNWRMQGVNLKTQLNFKKGIESLGIRAYGGHTLRNNSATIPDRYFYGGRLDLTQSKYIRIAGNAAGISDIPGTVPNASVNYNNLVYTTDFDFTLEGDKIKFVLGGEVGASHFELRKRDSSYNFDDFFYDLGAKGTYKPWNLTVGGSYRDVGANFNSPMAQTRRLSAPGEVIPSNFPTLSNGATGRSVGLFETYSQERRLYNQSISTTLMQYYIQYNMTEPYGKATPNRKGFTIMGEVETPNKVLTASAEANFLSEGVSEGDSITMEKRKFTLIQGGLVLNVNKLINFEKMIAINGGIRTESSKRGGINTVDLSSSLIDLGLDIEVIKDLHLIGGAKLFNVKGNEVTATRDQWNQIKTFTPVQFNQSQTILAAGLRYDYGQGCYFSAHYHDVAFKDTQNDQNTYKMNQLFFAFGLKF
jgi:hypothetical protein